MPKISIGKGYLSYKSDKFIKEKQIYQAIILLLFRYKIYDTVKYIENNLLILLIKF